MRSALDDERSGLGPGPLLLDCLLFAGHSGASTDSGATIFGFHPNAAGLPTWRMIEQLRNGGALPGLVRDDTTVFAAAQARGRRILQFDVVLPDPEFRSFRAALDSERQASQYAYGFPNGDGDCNCITCLERLGLPLLTGRMPEFATLAGFVSDPTRRFGRCV